MIPRKEIGTKYIDRFEGYFAVANQKSFGILGIFRYAAERFSQMRGVEGSASIAFFTIFGLPPLLIVIVSVASYYLEIPDIQERIIQVIEEILPIPPDLIIEFIEGILNQRGAVGIIGLIGLAWAASGVLMSLTANINRAWPSAKIRNVVEKRLIAFVMIGAFILFIAATSVLSTIIALYGQTRAHRPHTLHISGFVLGVMASTVTFPCAIKIPARAADALA